MTDNNIVSKKALIEGLLKDLEAIEFNDKDSLDAFLRRGEMILRKIYGDGHRNIARFMGVRFTSNILLFKPGANERVWSHGSTQMRNLLTTPLEEMDIYSFAQ